MLIMGSDCETSSEDEIFDDWMTEYYKAVRESDGFDVPPPPLKVPEDMLIIVPLTLEAEGAMEAMEFFANLGIDRYNKEKGTSLELVDLVKVMQQAIGPFTLYITFAAKETGNDQIRTYETRVVSRHPRSESYVEFTRVKRENKSRKRSRSRSGRRRGKGKKKKEGKGCSCCHKC